MDPFRDTQKNNCTPTHTGKLSNNALSLGMHPLLRCQYQKNTVLIVERCKVVRFVVCHLL